MTIHVKRELKNSLSNKSFQFQHFNMSFTFYYVMKINVNTL